MPVLSAKDYAAHRGVTAQAVSKAIKSGRLARSLVHGGGKKPKIDSDVADQEWAAKSDPSKVRGDAPAAKIGNTPMVAFGLPHGVNGTPAAEPPAMLRDYQTARANREHYLAETARLELEEKMGALVPADKVGEQWNAIAALVRAKVIAIGNKSKQRMPELTLEQVEIIELLSREALEDLAGAGVDQRQEVSHA